MKQQRLLRKLNNFGHDLCCVLASGNKMLYVYAVCRTNNQKKKKNKQIGAAFLIPICVNRFIHFFFNILLLFAEKVNITF